MVKRILPNFLTQIPGVPKNAPKITSNKINKKYLTHYDIFVERITIFEKLCLRKVDYNFGEISDSDPKSSCL